MINDVGGSPHRGHVFRSPGWYGLRLRRYWVLRDVTRHPLRFSERNRIKCRRLLLWRTWELWKKR